MSTKKKITSAKASVAKPTPAIKPIPDFFDKLGNKTYLLVLGTLLLIDIIVFKDYFFERIYCFKDIGSDTLNALYPFMYHTADYISRYGVPKWTFNFGMGENLFPFFLRDPFDIIFYITGKEHILYGIIYIELAKITFGGLLFYYYLKTIKLSDYTSLIGSLLFAFCSFMIVGGGWYIFSFEAFNMALLLLAFELLLVKQKWYLFPVAIFFIGVSMPFNLYIYGVFLILYAVLRCLQVNDFDVKKLGVLFLRMSALGVIGLLLSAPFLIENTAQLFESPRGNGSSSYLHKLASGSLFSIVDKLQLGTCVMRFFSSEILGSGSAFKGWGNNLEAPLFYCGLPCLLLMPQLFQFLEKKVKIVFIVFLSIWLLPIVFPYLRQAFWLFTGDYYRAYSFFVALTFLYFSLQALEFIIEKRKINKVVLISTLVALLVLINYPFFDNDPINTDVSFFVMIMLIVYGIILFFIPKQKNAVYLKWIFLAAVVFELIYLSNVSVTNRNALTVAELSQKMGYNDYSVDAINYLKKIDNSFYRVDKSYTSAPDKYTSYDDGMVQGYYGTSCYSSFNQQNYIFYLELMGLVDKTDEYRTRATLGTVGNFIVEDENNVKYILVKGNTAPFIHVCFDSLSMIGDVKILRNRIALPLGYSYNYFMKESSFDSLSTLQKDFTSLKASIVKDIDADRIKGIKELYLKDTTSAREFNTNVWGKEVADLKSDSLTINQFSQTFIKGTVNTAENKIMFLSIPFDGGWKLKMDGQPANKLILNGGMTGIMLEKGNHTIELKYELRYFYKGLILCLIGIIIYAGLLLFTRRKNIDVKNSN